MKSISNILSFLLLSTTLCLVPFCRSFTYSDNTIVLPTTTHNNDVVVSIPVLDRKGEPLKINEEYSIFSIPYGGGNVYLTDLGNTKCPNGVVQDSSGEFDNSTPVLFYTMMYGGDHIVYENQDVSIMFSTSSSSKSCVNETVWKAGYSIVGVTHSPPRFVITGGTLGPPGPNNIENWFKIEKYETGIPHSYKLRYCPSRYICPTCNFDCADVGLTYNSGHARLALNNKPYPFGFSKVIKTDA